MTRPLLALLMVLAFLAMVAFAIANRTLVTVSFDPFDTAAPAIVTEPVHLYLVCFAFLILGVVLGAIVAWFSEGKRRRHRRRLETELARVRGEFDRAKREALREMRGAPPPQQGSLPARLPAN